MSYLQSLLILQGINYTEFQKMIFEMQNLDVFTIRLGANID